MTTFQRAATTILADLDSVIDDAWTRGHTRVPGGPQWKHQGRDPHGQFTGNVGGAVGRLADVSAIASKLQAGERVEIEPGQVDELMGTLAGLPPVNLKALSIVGQGNETLFGPQHPHRSIPRTAMPQLPEDAAGMQVFRDALAARGVSVTLERSDPRRLRATQSELDSRDVGRMYGFIRDGKYREEIGAILASQDGFVLDGHHRWAGKAARAAATGLPADDDGRHGITSILTIGMDIDELLEFSEQFSGAKVGMGADLVTSRSGRPIKLGDKPTTPPPSEDEPWMWLDEEAGWVLIATDASDRRLLDRAEGDPKRAAAVILDELDCALGWTRAAGHDTDVGDNNLKHFWTKDPKGLSQWATLPEGRWTALYGHLVKHMPPEKAKRIASAWFKEVIGYSPGSDLNLVHAGKPPRGDRVGPG